MKNKHIITRDLLDVVTDEAKNTPRRRKNFNFHAGDEASCNRLLNAMEPDSYIRPHRHLDPEKDETLIVLRGRLGVVFFDGEGNVRETAVLTPEGDAMGVNIPHGEFHTVACLESGAVFFESKAGPYRPLTTEEKALWAPGEGSDDAAAYLAGLRRFCQA
jgi:cupin fold WbuC family metalloprotein